MLQTTTGVLLCNGDHQAEVGFCELVLAALSPRPPVWPAPPPHRRTGSSPGRFPSGTSAPGRPGCTLRPTYRVHQLLFLHLAQVQLSPRSSPTGGRGIVRARISPSLPPRSGSPVGPIFHSSSIFRRNVSFLILRSALKPRHASLRPLAIRDCRTQHRTRRLPLRAFSVNS